MRRTGDMLDIFKKIYPHFCDEKYLAFAILTQSCDLIRHGGKPCKAREINLAVIRPIRDILGPFLDGIAGTGVSQLLDERKRTKAIEFLDRVINQNEQALGLFYLHPDADAGISTESVIVLRVSIALRAREHFDSLVAARCGRLDTEFQHKLGWLVGNLYSRIATADWDDHGNNEIKQSKLVKRILEQPSPAFKPIWTNAKAVKKALANNIDLIKIIDKPDLLKQVLAQHAPTSVQQTIAQRVEHHVREVLFPKDVTEEQQRQIGNIIQRLQNDKQVETAILSSSNDS